jgi:phage tail protein X
MRTGVRVYQQRSMPVEPRQQLKLVGGVLLVGALTALPFARRAATKVEPVAPSAISPALQNVPLHLMAETTESPAVGLRDDDPPPVVPPTLVLGPSASASRLEDSGIPPDLPDSYHPLVERPPVNPAVAPRRESPAVPPPPPPAHQETSVRERTHRVVDGDTLARIAQRYWNDASLADALYNANRGTLSSPDPLPIGAVLTIPPLSSQPRVKISAAPVLEELPAPVRQPMPQLQLDEPLVPIERPNG